MSTPVLPYRKKVLIATTLNLHRDIEAILQGEIFVLIATDVRYIKHANNLINVEHSNYFAYEIKYTINILINIILIYY